MYSAGLIPGTSERLCADRLLRAVPCGLFSLLVFSFLERDGCFLVSLAEAFCTSDFVAALVSVWL
ncbi:MAG: hypothetical protein ACKPJD_30880, partial [Planctomycetaceae bacterium]